LNPRLQQAPVNLHVTVEDQKEDEVEEKLVQELQTKNPRTLH
jgi:hypothetical protein